MQSGVIYSSHRNILLQESMPKSLAVSDGVIKSVLNSVIKKLIVMPADHSRFSIITDGVYENINSKILDPLIKN